METRVAGDASPRACDFEHDDRATLARSAAIRSARELDPRTRARARAQTMSERLEEGFRLARFSNRLSRAMR